MDLECKVVAAHFAERGWVYVAVQFTKRECGGLREAEECREQAALRANREMVVGRVPG